MDLIGVVCEYDPFHNGHDYHLRESRRRLGDLPVVCVMSGDFTQRGDAALYDKHTRAEAACRCGADVVFELPLPWSLSSAERFARGAVGMLDRLGVNHLSFGAEEDDLEILGILAAAASKEETIAAIRSLMAAEPEQSFASARQTVIEKLCGRKAAALKEPNNILAVEYLRAIRNDSLSISPHAVRREGCAHDGQGEGRFCSASVLRRMAGEGQDITPFIPIEAAGVFGRETAAGCTMPSRELLDTALLSRLRTLDAARCASVPDAGSGLAERLQRAAAEEATVADICAAVKNKRFALSRVRRAVCCAALGVEEGMSDDNPPYARLLAASMRGLAVLSELKKKSRIPILAKPAAVRTLSPTAERIFECGAAAHDLYMLACPAKEARRGGSDWRASPRIIE